MAQLELLSTRTSGAENLSVQVFIVSGPFYAEELSGSEAQHLLRMTYADKFGHGAISCSVPQLRILDEKRTRCQVIEHLLQQV
jgi:hypothetical protein